MNTKLLAFARTSSGGSYLKISKFNPLLTGSAAFTPFGDFYPTKRDPDANAALIKFLEKQSTKTIASGSLNDEEFDSISPNAVKEVTLFITLGSKNKNPNSPDLKISASVGEGEEKKFLSIGAFWFKDTTEGVLELRESLGEYGKAIFTGSVYAIPKHEVAKTADTTSYDLPY